MEKFTLGLDLLSKWDRGCQLLSFVDLAHLCKHIDLLHCDGQDLRLPLLLTEVFDRIAKVLGALQAHICLRKLATRYAPTCSIEGCLECLEVFSCRLLLLRQLALSVPLQLRIYSARVDVDVKSFVFDGVVCELLVRLRCLRKVLGSVRLRLSVAQLLFLRYCTYGLRKNVLCLPVRL